MSFQPIELVRSAFANGGLAGERRIMSDSMSEVDRATTGSTSRSKMSATRCNMHFNSPLFSPTAIMCVSRGGIPRLVGAARQETRLPSRFPAHASGRFRGCGRPRQGSLFDDLCTNNGKDGLVLDLSKLSIPPCPRICIGLLIALDAMDSFEVRLECLCKQMFCWSVVRAGGKRRRGGGNRLRRDRRPGGEEES